MHRILGIDVGTVRVGVALSDPLGMTAQPFEVIQRKRSDPFERIAELVREHGVGCVVVGYPLRLDGTVGPAAQAIDAFVAELAKKIEIPIELWDERLTTVAAERQMIAGGARREKRKKTIDMVAAALILQSYLDAKGA